MVLNKIKVTAILLVFAFSGCAHVAKQSLSETDYIEKSLMKSVTKIGGQLETLQRSTMGQYTIKDELVINQTVAARLQKLPVKASAIDYSTEVGRGVVMEKINNFKTTVKWKGEAGQLVKKVAGKVGIDTEVTDGGEKIIINKKDVTIATLLQEIKNSGKYDIRVVPEENKIIVTPINTDVLNK